MRTKPTIVLVHGFWGGAAHWSKVIVDLSRKGYDKLCAVELPLTSLADDAARTRKMVGGTGEHRTTLSRKKRLAS